MRHKGASPIQRFQFRNRGNNLIALRSKVGQYSGIHVLIYKKRPVHLLTGLEI
jgi:hypothetical protein